MHQTDCALLQCSWYQEWTTQKRFSAIQLTQTMLNSPQYRLSCCASSSCATSNMGATHLSRVTWQQLTAATHHHWVTSSITINPARYNKIGPLPQILQFESRIQAADRRQEARVNNKQFHHDTESVAFTMQNNTPQHTLTVMQLGTKHTTESARLQMQQECCSHHH